MRNPPDWAAAWMAPIQEPSAYDPETVATARELDELLLSIWPALYDFEPGIADEADRRQQLFNAFDYNITPDKDRHETAQANRRLNMLHRFNALLELGNYREHWRIQLLPYPRRLPQEIESLPPHLFYKADTLASNLEGWLITLLDAWSDTHDRAVLRAMIFSLDMGITASAGLGQLAGANQVQGTYLGAVPYLFYLPLDTDPEPLTNWRLVMMPMASCLAMEQSRHEPAQTQPNTAITLSKRWKSELKALRQRFPDQTEVLPSNLVEWQQVVEFVQRLQTRPLLGASLANRLPDKGLDGYSISRLHHRSANLGMHPRPYTSDTPIKPPNSARTPLVAELTSIIYWPIQARRNGTTIPYTTIIASLTRLINCLPFGSAVYALATWMWQLFSRPAHDSLSPKTIRDYYNAARKVFRDTDTPLELPLEAPTVQSILDDVITNDHANGYHFKRFYYAVSYHCEWPDPSEWNWFPRTAASPGAPNIVTPDDYDRALACLHPEHEYEAKCRLIMILMFRCGLRVDEATGILPRDIEGSARPWLFIRPNAYRDLKHDSPPRKLPLYALLTADEMTELQSYMLTQGIDSACPLFPVSDNPYRLLKSNSVSETIGRVLREVTGDPDVTAHHLRHAAVSWLILSLLLNGASMEARSVIPGLSHSDFAPTRTRYLRQELLLDSTGKECLALVAKLVGHAGMTTTLTSYLHTLPLLHGLYRLNTIKAYQSRLNTLLGYTNRTAFHQLYKRDGAIGVYKRLRSQVLPDWPDWPRTCTAF